MALAAIKGDRTLVELAEQFTSTPIRSHRGRRSLKAGLPMSSALAAARAAQPAVDVKSLHAKIGALTLENNT